MVTPDDIGSTTIGMQLDAFLASLDAMPSTQLYAITVVVSIVFSFFLVNSDTSAAPNDEASTLKRFLESPRRKSKSSKSSRRSSRSDVAQPKWFILRALNYAVVIGFLTSVIHFASNASTYLAETSSVLRFLAGWSLFLCYFLGFFGISFVDPDEIIAESEEMEQRRQIAETPLTASNSSLATRGGESFLLESKTGGTPMTTDVNKSPKPLHPPASCTPVCSDGTRSAHSRTVPLSKSLVEASDEEVAQLVLSGQIKDHQLEKLLDPFRAVDVRRLVVDSKLASLGKGGALSDLPSKNSLDYGRVFGANCEIVVGYVPIPVGIVGPLTLDGETVYVPMATTEGCLVASTNRGCKAITQGSGAISTVVRDGITRAPCLRMRSAKEASELKLWCERPENFATLKAAFESTTSFGKLLSADPTVAGRNVYLRLRCFSGDAMGMNMVSKGSLAVIESLRLVFPSLSLVALSGNMCTDKKAAATNWIEGRGKSVIVEATIPKEIVKSTLKTDVATIVDTNTNKNLIGSAMAGALGGFNAHASNIVTAVFLATGQDPAQNVESSNCITILEETEEGDLWISCSMPSMEVGTVGGGTGLPAQAACLKAIGVHGGCKENAGDNARRLASVVAAATMAGELSLLAALAANTLVQAHMTHNRKPKGEASR